MMLTPRRLPSRSLASRLLPGLLCALGLALGSAQAATAPGAAQIPADRGIAAEQYRIGAGDTIRITVYQSPDLSLETKVTEAGLISYPLLGRVVLGGLTVNAAETHMAELLKKGEFIRDPQVIIVVTNVRANQVNVLGQVQKPGRVPLDVAGMHLTEVLAQAGGITPGGGSDTVVLIGTRDGKPFRHEIDLPRIFSATGSSGDVVIMPGDTLWVDRAAQAFIYGEVQKSGMLPIIRGMTVMQAVAASGGATQRGTLKGLRLTRRQADGASQTFEPSMEEPLKDGDVLFIRESLF